MEKEESNAQVYWNYLSNLKREETIAKEACKIVKAHLDKKEENVLHRMQEKFEDTSIDIKKSYKDFAFNTFLMIMTVIFSGLISLYLNLCEDEKTKYLTLALLIVLVIAIIVYILYKVIFDYMLINAYEKLLKQYTKCYEDRYDLVKLYKEQLGELEKQFICLLHKKELYKSNFVFLLNYGSESMYNTLLFNTEEKKEEKRKLIEQWKIINGKTIYEEYLITGIDYRKIIKNNIRLYEDLLLKLQ